MDATALPAPGSPMRGLGWAADLIPNLHILEACAMTRNPFPLSRGVAALALCAVPQRPPGRRMIVFDPTNYAQNVLTAARSLQQINNQITSASRTRRRC